MKKSKSGNIVFGVATPQEPADPLGRIQGELRDGDTNWSLKMGFCKLVQAGSQYPVDVLGKSLYTPSSSL